MTRSTHYELLGIEPDASPAEIREARRARLIVTHPDRGRTLEDRARREQLSAAINLAADTLLDPRTRRLYDRRIGIRSPLLPPAATRAVRRGSAPLIHTRIGQWGILLAIILLGGAFGVAPLLVGLIAVGVTLLLARAGNPTPLTDLERIVTRAAHFLRGPGARAGRAATAAATASFRERLAEARRDAEGGATSGGSMPPRRGAFSAPDGDEERPRSARGGGRAPHR